MLRNSFLASIALTCLAAAPTVAQHVQNSPVAPDPLQTERVWVANRDNGSVAVVDVNSNSVVAEIAVGVWPRSLAFSADGSKVYVANQRGNVPVEVHFASPFGGGEVRGSLSIINTSTLSVTTTLTNVGIEPYGVVVSPNGKYFAVTGTRSGTLKLFDATSNALLATLQYDNNLSVIPSGTIATVDSNKDFVADLSEPRDMVVKSDSARIYVAHNTSPFISVVDVTLNGSGVPTGISLFKKINLNTYAFDNLFNPSPVQVVQSQGTPRFLTGIALSPDGSRLFVPSLLHNINHDVNFNFGTQIAGAFANRVYPTISVVDSVLNSFNQGGDSSARAHNEIADPLTPAQFVPFGPKGATTTNGLASFGGVGSPVINANATFVMTGGKAGDVGFLWYGLETNVSLGSMGTLLVTQVSPLFGFPNTAGTFTRTLFVPNDPNLVGLGLPMQAAIFEVPSLTIKLSNGLKSVFGTQGPGSGKLGLRPGHPQQVVTNSSGTRLLLLNRGSEDLFLYSVSGSSITLMNAYPPRFGFQARTPFDNTTPMGDMPLGMIVKSDTSTSNDDALVYVVNEASRTLSSLRVDWGTGAITKEAAQVVTHVGPDIKTLSERIGQELFEDSSRPQTSGNFNNSCHSCHFEGGADSNVWQRPAGPRSTMPVFGGALGTGLILWKGVRLNLGETGPMFGGENGGTGVLTDAEQQGLVDYHNVIPVPLNPNLDPVTGLLTAQAALGKDLFFGNNDTGLNPTHRTAGCGTCHATNDSVSGDKRDFTVDFIDPVLTGGENLATYTGGDCSALKENVVGVNIRDVNSGVNVDVDGDTFPDLDRNFDGYNDLETYTPMNVDTSDDFQRDDANSYLCPDDPLFPNGPFKTFMRGPGKFSIPTKLGIFSTGPYFHDHVVQSLRALIDPSSQTTDPVYGDPTYPKLQKVFNEFHDVRGHQEFVPSVSKVQLNLQSTNVQADIEALLAFIQSL